MVSVVSSVSCWFWNLSMSILYKNARNVRFVLFRKNSILMSCSVESRNNLSPKKMKWSKKQSYISGFSIHGWNKHLIFDLLVVGVVSSIPTGGSLILGNFFNTYWCQYWPEMPDMYWKRKPRLSQMCVTEKKAFSSVIYSFLQTCTDTFLLFVCELTADGSICKASVNTDDSIWGTALAVKLLVKLLSSL